MRSGKVLDIVAVFAAAGLLACGETLPIQYETEHLRIGTNFEFQLGS